MSLAMDNKAASTLSDQQQYRLLFAATFAIFFAVALVKRLYRAARGMPGPLTTPRSLFAEAKATGYSTLALAFMG